MRNIGFYYTSDFYRFEMDSGDYAGFIRTPGGGSSGGDRGRNLRLQRNGLILG